MGASFGGTGTHRFKGATEVIVIVAVIVAILKAGIAVRVHRAAPHNVPRQAFQVLQQYIFSPVNMHANKPRLVQRCKRSTPERSAHAACSSLCQRPVF